MQVTIKGEVKQLYVQTITLQPEKGDNLYGFHCLTCGNFHRKIGGKVSKIYPLYEPSEQVPAISKCRNCGSEYDFQTHDGYETNKIKVILHAKPSIDSDSKTSFYCYRGKDAILEYDNKSIFSLIDNEKKTVPFTSPCINADCPVMYYFSDIF